MTITVEILTVILV